MRATGNSDQPDNNKFGSGVREETQIQAAETAGPGPGAGDALRFLKAIFAPQDLILFRPIETWNEGGKKHSKVDHDGIRYERFGGRCGQEWAWHDSRLTAGIGRIVDRTAATFCNVFFGVCPRHGPNQQYDQAWQIRTIRCLWADLDDCQPDQAAERCRANSVPQPSIIVASGNGTHLYWLLDQPALIDDAGPPQPVHVEWLDRGEGKPKQRRLYLIDSATKERLSLDARQNVPPLSPKAQTIQDAIAGIAGRIGGDHTTDLSRILRLPGTLNRKDQRSGRAPTECRLVHLDPDCRYPLLTLLQFASGSPAKTKRDKIGQIPLPRKLPMAGKRQSRMDALVAACVAAEPGRRSEADFALAAYAVECGQDADATWQAVGSVGKFAEAGRRYFDLTWEAAKLHTREQIFAGVVARAEKREKQRAAGECDEAGDTSGGRSAPAPGRSGAVVIEAEDDPHRLARVNLEKYATMTNGRTLRYWRDEWYVWKRNAYRRITKDEFRAKLSHSVYEEFERIHQEKMADPARDPNEPLAIQKVTMALVSNVMQATSGMVCVGSDIEPNTWLPTREERHYVSMQNGILDLDAVMEDKPFEECMWPNSPEWFSQVSLPYAFDPDARCPKFEAYLEYNLEMDPERIKVLQEWAGYLLLPDTSEQRFLVLEGEGANGKTVYIAVLTAMLGQENVSTVPLEKFGDRFSLTATLGKLLNAAGDCGELDKSAEGDLKSFTGGDRMFFDRKGIAGVTCRPTARLLLACNNRPRISDRSQGVWRRMLLMPFRVEITREKRVRGMDRVGWWEQSGELPGILNWALVGLARLRAQRGFTDSEVMAAAMQDYQQEMNPARVFLDENLERDDHHYLKCKEVYRLYRRWCEESGTHPLAQTNFGREVFRRFSGIERKYSGTKQERFWIYAGLKFSQDEICGETVDPATLF
jgi:P4 family phage/plasmid primase-like protien